MGLMWGEVDADIMQYGYGPDGQTWVQISGTNMSCSAWIWPQACGEPRGVLLQGFTRRADARAAVERWFEEHGRL